MLGSNPGRVGRNDDSESSHVLRYVRAVVRESIGYSTKCIPFASV
eukprot:SAG11_NODE_15702_length_569_cov_0.551064_1_plen_44_part_01